MTETKLKKQFIYPEHATLKRAYQGIIYKVLNEKRIVFRPADLVLAIIDHLGWEDDSGLDSPERKPGPRYKRAKNILRSFEGSFTKFSGSSLEVFIFNLDKKRVSSFKELESLCALDTDLSELIATIDKFDLTQPWQDIRTLNPTYPVSSEISNIDYKLKEKQDNIVNSRNMGKKKRHDGIVKGNKLKLDPYNIPDSFGDEDIEGTDSLQDEDFRNHPNSGRPVEISDGQRGKE